MPSWYLRQLAREGLLEKVSRGLYAPADAAVSEHRSLAEVAKRTPRGVICLLSALCIHGLTTQTPFDVWLAIGPKDRAPRPAGIGLRIARFSGSVTHCRDPDAAHRRSPRACVRTGQDGGGLLQVPQ